MSLKSVGEEIFELGVRDNGIGLPSNFDIARPRSMGMDLVRRLAKQLHADLDVTGADGTRFRLRFKASQADGATK